MLLVYLTTAATPACTLDVPAHGVHYDLRGLSDVLGEYKKSSDGLVDEGLFEAGELVRSGQKSQDWFDMKAEEIGGMRGLLMSTIV